MWQAHLNYECFASEAGSNAYHSHVFCTIDEHLQAVKHPLYTAHQVLTYCLTNKSTN